VEVPWNDLKKSILDTMSYFGLESREQSKKAMDNIENDQ
jgi:hypothetical protein